MAYYQTNYANDAGRIFEEEAEQRRREDEQRLRED